MRLLFFASLVLALALPIRANAAAVTTDLVTNSHWTFTSDDLASALADDSEGLAPHTWTCIARNAAGKRFINTGESQAQAWLRAFGDCGQYMRVARAMRDCNVTRCFRMLR